MSDDSSGTTDGQPGPGWWQASDGNWYPPESAPGATPPPTPPTPPAGPPPPGAMAGGTPPPGGPTPPPPGFGAPPPSGSSSSGSSGAVKVLLIVAGVIGALVVLSLVSILAITFLGGDEPDRDETGAIEEEGDLGVFSLRVGDCFDDAAGALGGAEVESVPAVPCDEPHDNEVFAKPTLTDGPYPGDDEIYVEALERCVDEFAAYTGEDYDTSELEVFPITPTRATWEDGDVHFAVCALYNLDLSKLTGSQAAG